MSYTTATRTRRRLKARLAQNQLEIERALALRFDVFRTEMNAGTADTTPDDGKDRDRYDLYCDHLIVVDEDRNDLVVGTYRILRRAVARKHEGFYSAGEFNLDAIDALDREPAEIGRSCVHPDYRDGSVISMLWQGLTAYMRDHNVQYLMGCASVPGVSAELGSRVYAWLREKGAIAPQEFQVTPLPGYVLEGFRKDYPADDMKALGRMIPPLIKGYLRAGTLVCGTPALDRDFGTIDFFVLFNRDDVEKRYGRHFLTDNS